MPFSFLRSHSQASALRASVLLTCLWMWLLGWSVAAVLAYQGQAQTALFALNAAAGPVAWLTAWVGRFGYWRGVAVWLIAFIFCVTVVVGFLRGQFVVASLMNIAVLTLFAGWSLGLVATLLVTALSQGLLVMLVMQGSFAWSELFPMMFTCLFMGAVTVIARRAYERHMHKIESSVAALADQQQRLHLLTSVVEQSPHTVLLVDLQGRVVYANPAFTQQTGYSEQELQGQRSLDVSLSGMDAQEHAAMRKLTEAGGVWRGVLRNVNKDGDTFTESVTIAPVHDEHGALRYLVEIKQDISERVYAQERISQLLNYDNLTQLPNRFALLRRLDELLLRERLQQQSGRVHAWHGLLLLDMDRFNKFNLVHGSEWGDALLIAVAMRLQELLSERGWVARYTADQFAVVLENIGTSRADARQQAYAMATELRTALTSLSLLNEPEPVVISFGTGVTVFPFVEPGSPADASDHIVRRANIALSHAKRQGLGQVQAYAKGLAENAQRHLQLERDLRVALEQGQLRLYVQPQYNMYGRVDNLEALVRWQHPEEGLLLPGHFIALAEETGQIVQIGDWMLEQACLLLQDPSMRQGGYNLAVNISPLQFMQADFVPRLKALLERTQVPPHLLTLEVTESMLLADIGETISKMLMLREIGVQFALDDFGTGYSSLSYLQRLPIQEIKVDQSFIQELDPSGVSGALVQAILMVAKQLRLRVVAEGVERVEHVELLQAWDPAILCQGYYFTKPMSVEAWLQLLALEAPATHRQL